MNANLSESHYVAVVTVFAALLINLCIILLMVGYIALVPILTMFEGGAQPPWE